MISNRAEEKAKTLIAATYCESGTRSSLISRTRRRCSPTSKPTEIVFSTSNRRSDPATYVLVSPNRMTLAIRGVRNDFVVARK